MRLVLKLVAVGLVVMMPVDVGLLFGQVIISMMRF